VVNVPWYLSEEPAPTDGRGERGEPTSSPPAGRGARGEPTGSPPKTGGPEQK
jgi:hypothetical protein